MPLLCIGRRDVGSSLGDNVGWNGETLASQVRLQLLCLLVAKHAGLRANVGMAVKVKELQLPLKL